MPYTSHGHPYGTVSPDEPRPVLVARCGGPPMCAQCAREAAHVCEPAPPVIDVQAERMADAYNLGIKADALREFATDLEGVPHYPAAILARKKAEVLDAQAEELAAANAPAAPAEPTTEARRLAETVIRTRLRDIPQTRLSVICEVISEDLGRPIDAEIYRLSWDVRAALCEARVDATVSWLHQADTPETQP